MNEQNQNDSRQVIEGWLEGHAPASAPYIIAFSIFVPLILGVNIALEFWLGELEFWVATVRQGMLNAGTMSTWGIPLTIVLTEGVTRMLARHYIARKEKEAKLEFDKVREEQEAVRVEQKAVREEQQAERERQLAWYREQMAWWEELKALAEAEGREFDFPPPPTPPGANGSGKGGG